MKNDFELGAMTSAIYQPNDSLQNEWYFIKKVIPAKQKKTPPMVKNNVSNQNLTGCELRS